MNAESHGVYFVAVPLTRPFFLLLSMVSVDCEANADDGLQ